MNLKITVGFICFVIMVSNCCGHVDNKLDLYQDLTHRVYCGRMLARALAYLCYDATMNNDKPEDTVNNAILSPYYKHHEKSEHRPWMSHHGAKSLRIWSPAKRFVVNECCNRACSISELLSFC